MAVGSDFKIRFSHGNEFLKKKWCLLQCEYSNFLIVEETNDEILFLKNQFLLIGVPKKINLITSENYEKYETNVKKIVEFNSSEFVIEPYSFRLSLFLMIWDIEKNIKQDINFYLSTPTLFSFKNYLHMCLTSQVPFEDLFIIDHPLKLINNLKWKNNYLRIRRTPNDIIFNKKSDECFQLKKWENIRNCREKNIKNIFCSKNNWEEKIKSKFFLMMLFCVFVQIKLQE